MKPLFRKTKQNHPHDKATKLTQLDLAPFGSLRLPASQHIRVSDGDQLGMTLPAASRSVAPHRCHFMSPRENFLVLDVFFEALTSEAMEQRAAYGLSALLGKP